MPVFEFVRQSARDPANLQGTGERLVNLYAEPMAPGAGAAFALKAVPGLAAFADLPGVFVRALESAPRYSDAGVPSDRLAAVSNGTLHEIDAAGVVTALAAVPDDERTGLSTNNGMITVTAGGRYFVWTGTALDEPTPGAFSSFGGVEFLGDYTILTERNDRRFCWSALADATDLPSLNFATAEARDDAILRPLSVGGNLWLFKATSIEVWGATGLAGAAAFQRLTVVETGLRAFSLLAKVAGGAFFVGNDGIVYLTGGTPNLQPISTPAVNEAIAAHARAILPQEVTFFHHCNTGALAAVGVGTALGIIRRAHEAGHKVFAYLDETRPRLQGAKLSSFELMEYGVPHAVVVDGASAHIMRKRQVDIAVVGCDRVAANADTANKIGTYNLALAAQDNRVPFYVACPTSTIDMGTPTGDGIEIEERAEEEVLVVNGASIAPNGARAFNPAFDVTPNRLIAGLITEKGIIRPPFDVNLRALFGG